MSTTSGSGTNESGRDVNPRVTLSHRLQYALFRAVRGSLALLPDAVGLRLGEALGWVAGVVFRVRRDVVRDNLERAFPDRSPAWRRRTAVASYRHLGRESVATFLLGTADREKVRALTVVEGLDGLRDDLARGKGAVLVTGHLGNWEIGGAALAARGIPVDGVVQVQRNPLFDRDLRETREALGMTVVPKQAAPRRALAALRRGHAVGLVADQNVVVGGLAVDFFGVPAATARGPALFALRTGAPVWVGVGLYTGPGRPRYRVRLRPIPFQTSGDPATDVQRLTEAHVRALESLIREAPEQYFWQHKRWKSRPSIPELSDSGDHITG